MRFKKTSIPDPSEGVSFKGIPSMTVPDQALSLQEILEKFTLGQSVPGLTPYAVAGDEDSLEVDYEKAMNADLLDQKQVIQDLAEQGQLELPFDSGAAAPPAAPGVSEPPEQQGGGQQ